MVSLFSQQQVHRGGCLGCGGFLPVGLLPSNMVGPFQDAGPQGVADVVRPGLGIEGRGRHEGALDGRIGAVALTEHVCFEEGPASRLVQLNGPIGALALKLVREGELLQKDVLEDRPEYCFADQRGVSDRLVTVEVQIDHVLLPPGDL